MHEMQLMHHFTTVVYTTLSGPSMKERMWQVEVPREAMVHPYLKHGVLAVSALHLHYVDSRDSSHYEVAAQRYFHLAISSLRPLVGQSSPTNCNALFALSTLVLAFTLALPQSTCGYHF
jgi:hypothetical protein